MCAGQPDHQYERQVPEEDEQMAAPRSHAELLQVVSSPDPGAHQGQAPRHDADKPMVGDHTRGCPCHRLNQRRVCRAASQVIVDRPARDYRAEPTQDDHYHIWH